MPLDSVTLTALAGELRSKLIGCRVDKVQQPERDTVLLTVHGPNAAGRLVLCGGVGVARAHFTAARYENPAQPPMFCMLLRKHLLGAKLAELEQPERERLLLLRFDARDELGLPVQKTLALELIGRGTNLILIDGDGRILDCLRRVDAERNPLRQVLPGLLYRLPPRPEKPDFFALTPEARGALWAGFDGQREADRFLLDTFNGLSPLLCRELVHRCRGDLSTMPDAMDALAQTVLAGDFVPWMLLRDGKPQDFSCLPIAQYGEAMLFERFPDFSALLDAFYTRRSQAEDLRRRTAELRKTVKNARDRCLRKLAMQESELEKTARRDEKRRWGDLITANLYRAPRPGARSMTATDYYAEGCPEVTVPLDPLKSAVQNAAAYYKEYNKAKTAERYLTELLERGRRDAQYLSSVLDELDRVRSQSDIAEVRRELTETGYLRAMKNAPRQKEREAAPLRYLSSGGFEILVGRNNRMNDRLTFRLARKGDLWLHVQKLHGSHVILRCDGAEPDAQSLREAASLAATHSQAGEGGKVPVDCTRVKYVKKTPGALPGMVIYTEQSTLSAEADTALEERLRQK